MKTFLVNYMGGIQMAILAQDNRVAIERFVGIHTFLIGRRIDRFRVEEL